MIVNQAQQRAFHRVITGHQVTVPICYPGPKNNQRSPQWDSIRREMIRSLDEKLHKKQAILWVIGHAMLRQTNGLKLFRRNYFLAILNDRTTFSESQTGILLYQTVC